MKKVFIAFTSASLSTGFAGLAVQMYGREFQITMCPTCGSKKIRRVTRDITRQYKGREYVVPKVDFYDCPVCGEKVFDREAIQKIEAYSPAYRKVKNLMPSRQRQFRSPKTAPTPPP